MRQPPENSCTGALLGGLVEAEAGEDGGGARGGGVGADGAQAVVDFGEAVGVGGVGLGEQRQAFGVALQDGVEQGGGAGRGFLRDGGEAGAGGQADVAAIQRHVAGDGAQQRGLARAVAADQADAAAGVDRQVGAVQQVRPPRRMVTARYSQKGHGAVLSGGRARTVECAPCLAAATVPRLAADHASGQRPRDDAEGTMPRA